MKSLEETLTQYAAYHRDKRNVATHFVGIPMIVFAVLLALETASFSLGGWTVSAAALVSVVACAYYLKLDWAMGLAMAVTLFVLCAASSEIEPRLGSAATLATAAFFFILGWGLQFQGHKYEGMKPAFFDDVAQLAIGPLFVCAETFFAFGGRAKLRRYIEERVGPTVARRRHPSPGEPATR
ncbi:MAG TPA: Mpo1-like protein [Usitatibacter sp.]|nr:Mpo1-like protein [Usitatibacter sp.]